MSEVQLEIAPLGTREIIKKIKASVVVVGAVADETTVLPVVFDKPFVNIPELMGVLCTDDAVIKGNVSATNITKLGMDVNIYRVLAADVVAGTYVVEISLVGWKT